MWMLRGIFLDRSATPPCGDARGLRLDSNLFTPSASALKVASQHFINAQPPLTTMLLWTSCRVLYHQPKTGVGYGTKNQIFTKKFSKEWNVGWCCSDC
jgi:hypothetical protein